MDLREGQTYTFKSQETADEGAKKKLVVRKMRLIKKYPHHALFEDSRGIRTAFRYWDAERLIKGEAV